MKKALFAGLVVDEFDNPVTIAYVGSDPCYVVNDAGFHRHISEDQVDHQVFQMMTEMVKGNEEPISEQAENARPGRYLFVGDDRQPVEKHREAI